MVERDTHQVCETSPISEASAYEQRDLVYTEAPLTSPLRCKELRAADSAITITGSMADVVTMQLLTGGVFGTLCPRLDYRVGQKSEICAFSVPCCTIICIVAAVVHIVQRFHCVRRRRLSEAMKHVARPPSGRW